MVDGALRGGRGRRRGGVTCPLRGACVPRTGITTRGSPAPNTKTHAGVAVPSTRWRGAAVGRSSGRWALGPGAWAVIVNPRRGVDWGCS